VDLSTTAASVNEILTNPEFAKQIRDHNKWSAEASDVHTAILFFAVRYQEAVEILHRRTTDLNRREGSNSARICDLEERSFPEHG